MRIARILVVLLGLHLILGCASMQFGSDYDPQTDFGSLRSYDWLPAAEHILKKYPLLDSHIKKVVDAELSARGYEKNTNAQDFLIRYHATVEEKEEVVRVNEYYHYPTHSGWQYTHHPSSWYGQSYQQVHEWTEGTLVLDIVEPTSESLMWRGTAEARLQDKRSREEKDKLVKKAVKGILDRLPSK